MWWLGVLSILASQVVPRSGSSFKYLLKYLKKLPGKHSVCQLVKGALYGTCPLSKEGSGPPGVQNFVVIYCILCVLTQL